MDLNEELLVLKIHVKITDPKVKMKKIDVCHSKISRSNIFLKKTNCSVYWI